MGIFDGSFGANEFTKCVRVFDGEAAKAFRFDPDQDVELERCVQLPHGKSSSNGQSSSLASSLTFESLKGPIERMVVVSQCKRIEVYVGKLSEYHTTCTGEFLDSAEEELSMFKVSVKLSEANSNVTLKLTGLSDSFCWVMGVFICLTDVQRGKASVSHFDMKKVNQLLDEKPENLSESALKFKNLFETFQHQGPLASQAPIGMAAAAGLMGFNTILKQSPVKSAEEQPDAPSNLGSQIKPGDSNQNADMSGDNNVSDHKTSSCSNCLTLDQMEKRILRRIDELEERQNAKIQQLIQILLALKTS